jgi:hypothetical protein
MNLKIKRNLPLILMLVAFLSFLTIAIGGLPIIAYSL